MTNKTKNPLTQIGDQQWIKLVEMLCENVLALNSRILFKVEMQFTQGGHYPAVYFRLTTILESSAEQDLKTEVSGFVFGLITIGMMMYIFTHYPHKDIGKIG